MMKSKIEVINGITVEIPELDDLGEKERDKLAALATQEYNKTGTLSSPSLQEANRKFVEDAKSHMLRDDKAECVADDEEKRE